MLVPLGSKVAMQKDRGCEGCLSKLARGNGVSDMAGLKAVEADTLMSYFCYTQEGSEGLKDNFDLENLKKSWPTHQGHQASIDHCAGRCLV